MGNKKVRVFAVGAFVFAKVKGYPAWPAKITGVVGKRYGIYFYGTGESATLPPNEIFDYFDSKQQFAAKSIKRKFYQEGIQQLEAELLLLNVTSNENLPDETLNESQIDNPVADQSSASVEDAAEPEPVKAEEPPAPAPTPAEVQAPEEKEEKPVAKKRGRKSSNLVVKEQAATPTPAIAPAAVEEPEPQVESAAAEELSTPNEPEAASEPVPVVEEPITETVTLKTVDEKHKEDATPKEAVEEAPVQKGRGKRGAPKTPTSAPPSKAPRRSNKVAAEASAPEAPKTPVAAPAAPEGTSRSGRKIKPKKYTDMEVEDAAEAGDEPPTKKSKSVDEPESQQLPEAGAEAEPEPPTPTKKSGSKSHTPGKKTTNARSQNGTSKRSDPSYRIVYAHEIQDIQETITQTFGDELLDNNSLKHTLLSILPDDRIVGIKLFTNPPESFASPEARVKWENASAKAALKLKEQLETGETDLTSVLPQIDMNVPLLEEEVKAMKKQRSTDVEKTRLTLLRTECKLLDLVDQVTGTLCFESADCDNCIELLNQMADLKVQPIMLIKHPNVMETVKRCRRYVGNLEHWGMSSEEKIEFTKKAHLIRLKAEHCYNTYKKPFGIEENKRFWEFFMLKVQRFKQITEKMSEVDILKISSEPKELAELRPDDMQVVEVNKSKSTKASSKSIKS